MKTLPAHTTRYFAEQAYFLFFTRGTIKPLKNKTVYGIELTCLYGNGQVTCTYEIAGKQVTKVERVRKSWSSL